MMRSQMIFTVNDEISSRLIKNELLKGVLIWLDG